MAFLIDTDVAIHARDGTETILDKLNEYPGKVLLSALSLAELQRGTYRDPTLAARRQGALDLLLEVVPVIPFDEAAARAYGRIIAQLGWARNRDYDRMIAAHAISIEAVLVTINTADFHGIPGLKLERWRIPPRSA